MRSATALSTLLASGCIVYADPDPGPAPVNDPPVIEWADASCFYDEYYRDDVWWFEADLRDDEGLDDVVAVYADVYDGLTEEWVDAFELYHDSGHTWYSAWQQDSTWLDCDHYDYIVDFVAEDVVGEGEVYTVVLY